MSQSANYISVNPYTGEFFNEIPLWDQNRISEELGKSHRAYLAWRNTTVEERKLFLANLSTYFLENKEMISRTITDEMGKPITQSLAEVEKSASLCRYYHDNIESFDKPKKISLDAGRFGLIRGQPQGAVLGVMPWNFPLWQAVRFAVPVLSGGNVVLLKHAQNVGLTALIIEKAIEESCGLKGILKTVFISHEDAGLILAHDHVIGTSLTGSEKAGVSIGRLAGQNIKKSVMELGGSDPFIVLKDANVNKSVVHAARARLNNNGQTCIAAKRFIIDQSIADEWLEGFVREIKNYRVGSPYDKSTQVSGLARKDLALTLDEQVKKSVKQGAGKALSGGLDSDISSLYHPEILVNIPENSPVSNEETFGPVAGVFIVKNEDEMLTKVNSSRFGLGASIWSRDQERAIRLAYKIEAGSVSVNQMLSSDPRLPFGGIKKSGFGREMALEGYFEFLNLKTIIAGNE